MTEIMAHEQEQGHDLDFAIRRECLRLEILRMTEGDEDEAHPAEEGQAEDVGLQRWNTAVKKGGVAMLAARDEARTPLAAKSEEVAARPLRPARWVDEKEADKDAGGAGPTLVTGGDNHSAGQNGKGGNDEASEQERDADLVAAVRAATTPEERRAATEQYYEVAAERDKAERALRRRRLTRLHEVRIPPDVVERCKVCDAAIATGAGHCVTCTGLGLDVPPESPIERLQREAIAKWAAADRGSSDSDSENEPAVEVDSVATRTRNRGRGSGRVRRRDRAAFRRQQWGAGTVDLRIAGDRFDFVDDVGVTEAAESMQEAVTAASGRITAIAVSSKVKADQHMAPKKCVILPVQPASAVGETTMADVIALNLKHQCDCGEPFASVWGLRVHSRTCLTALVEFEKDADGDEYQDVEALLDVRGPPERRFWRVKWAGKNAAGEDKWPDRGAGNGKAAYGWMSEQYLSVGMVDQQNKFWRTTGLDRRSACSGPDEEHRCDRCNQIFATGAAFKRHHAKPTKANRAFLRLCVRNA
jgi:hypothetical protein